MPGRIHAAVLALALALAAPAAFAQHLTVNAPVKDVGTVPKGEKIDWTFTVANTGSADLQILAAKPGCGCTVVDFDKVIRPGQSGKVIAHVDTSAFSGPIAKSVTLETNDPSSPTAQLTVRAVVKPYVEAHPAGFLRYNLLLGDAEKQSVILYSEEAEPFEIVSIASPADWIKVTRTRLKGAEIVPNVGRAGQAQYRLDITVGGPDARIGPIAEKIHVTTNARHQPAYDLAVSGVIRPPYRVDPLRINFGDVAPGDAAAMRIIIVRSNNLKAPETFVVNQASTDVPGVTAMVSQAANKGEFQVTVRVGPPARPGPFEGAVRIVTNDPVNPVVTIPIKGVAKVGV